MRKVSLAKILCSALVLAAASVLPARADCGCAAAPKPACNGGCPQTSDCNCAAAPAPKTVVYERVTFSEEPLPSEYVMHETYQEKASVPVLQPLNRPVAAAEAAAAPAEVKNPKDGSIFGGGPCKTCTKDGSIFGGGPCKTCTKDGSIFGGGPCKTCKKPQPKKCAGNCPQRCVTYNDDLYNSIHPQCQDLAPVELQFVDFRLQNDYNNKAYARKLGQYRFRIFGCRRYSKNALLNEGHILEKDMKFVEIFDDVVSDCNHVVKIPDDLCIRQDAPLPEYVLTAEIVGYHMNLCDEYDWKRAAKADRRNGSSEMTVNWRLMDLTKTNVFWKGTTNGYGELLDGEENGEMILIERAFADAVESLRNLPDFEDQLTKRVSAEEMERQRQALIELQRRNNPAKCQFAEPVICENSGSVSTGYGLVEGGAIAEQKTVPCKAPVEDKAIVEPQPTPCEIKVETVESVAIVEPQPTVEPRPIACETPVAPLETQAAVSSDSLCIMERDAYDSMTPENVYKIRSSIVSIRNAKGQQGAGLLISEQFIMTSADLMDKATNDYYVETVNGAKLKAKAFRVNHKRNTALLALNEPTEYSPLALNLELPPVGKGKYLTFGMTSFEEGEGYLENGSKVNGYRYAADGTAEIVTDSFVQEAALGSALIDEHGRVVGIAHSRRHSKDSPDLFLPIETAMKSLGVEICGKAFPEPKPRPQKSWRQPVASLIDNTVAKAPEAMDKKERK